MNPSNKKPKQPTPFPLAAGFPEQCTNWSKPQGERLDGNENKKSKLSNLRLVRSSRAWRRKASTAWNGDGDMLIMLILLIQLSCWINAKILVNFLAGQPIKLKNQLYNKWSKSLRVKCVWGGGLNHFRLKVNGQHFIRQSWRIQTRDLIWRNEIGSFSKIIKRFFINYPFSSFQHEESVWGCSHSCRSSRERSARR